MREGLDVLLVDLQTSDRVLHVIWTLYLLQFARAREVPHPGVSLDAANPITGVRLKAVLTEL